MKFTDASVRALRPRAERYEVFEDTRAGFGVRVSERGRKTWIYVYRFKGRPRRLTLGVYTQGASPSDPVFMSLAKAHTAWARAREQLAAGNDPGAGAVTAREAARKAPTVEQLTEEYLERHAKPKKRSWEEDERIIDTYILPAWKHRKATDVSKRDVTLLLDDIRDHGAPNRPEKERRPAPIMANRVRSLLSRLFRFAVARHIVDTSPVFGVEKPAQENKRTRHLGTDEIKHFWKHVEDARTGLSQPFALGMKILLVTAQRKGELALARWDNVDLDQKLWTIPDTNAKNKQTHLVPLSDFAIELFKSLRAITGAIREDEETERVRASDGAVLPSPLYDRPAIRATALDRALRRALNKKQSPNSPLLEMTAFTPHDLRRTAATGMGELGFDDFTIGLVLNHKSRGITGRYNLAAYEPQKRRVLDAWAARLRELVEAETANVVPMSSAKSRRKKVATTA